MLTQEYLEIIGLAKSLLMEQLPKKAPPLPKPAALPIENKVIPTVIPKPILIKKEPPAVKEIIQVETASCNLDPILEMLKTHCPKLKLVDLPIEIQKTAIILFDQESEPEVKLLENITSALKKAGHTAYLFSASDLKDEHMQNPSNVLIGSRTTFSNHQHIKVHARKGASGKLLIGESGALAIPSLLELIEQPSKRRDVWNEILALL